MTVTALLVSHDGARWLPAVLDGLESQTVRPHRVLAVDTGSVDASHDILAGRLGLEAVLSLPERTPFGAAVLAGLDALPATGPDDEWLWLLHDDSRPAPDALEQLLAAAAANPSADVLGPKLREWPSLRRLLEVGITMSGTGRRETGLERGEYDQGQHDRTRDVLAVGSAGMLVRRSVFLALGGFDKRLPMFGNDLDFGWRAARAGHRTLLVPEAVLFHVEAAHRGVRRTPLTTASHRRAARSAALYTLLANCSLVALPFQLVRLFLGSLLRALGLLLVRAPREAYDEVLAVLGTYARPHRIVAARLARRRTATVPARDVRHLLAPPWLPYRHGLDMVTDLALAVAAQAGETTSARRAARTEAVEAGPVDDEAENLPADTGLVARLLSSPTAGVFALLVLLALVGTRGLLGSGLLSGGALLPAPGAAGDWWRVYLESWHADGIGSGVPAAPYLLPLALAGTVLLGKAWLVVDLLFLLCVPLAAFGGFRFLRRLTPSRWAALWGGVAYGLLPVLTGAVAQGRLGTVAASVVLPWVAHAALFLGVRHDRDRRWRAAWRTALLLALLSSFVPQAWLVAVLAVVVLLAFAAATGAREWTRRSGWGPVAVAVLAVPVLLLPWSVLTFAGRGADAWLTEAGLPATDLLGPLGLLDVVLGRAVAAGSAPVWLSAGVVLAAVASLLRRDTRTPVLASWTVLVLALVTAAVLAPRGEWLGFPLLLAQAAAVTAAAVAGTDIAAQLSGRSFGWRQPVGAAVVVVALVSPVLGLFWWAASGIDGELDRRAPGSVPTYMTDAATRDPDSGVLVVRSTEGSDLEYLVLRGDGQRLGDDTVAPAPEDQQELTDLVESLATAPQAPDVERLGAHGVEFVYAAPPADPVLVGNLDSVSGLTSASAVRPGSRAWQLEAEPSDEALPAPEGSPRPVLLGVQGLALVLAAVLAAPSRRPRR